MGKTNAQRQAAWRRRAQEARHFQKEYQRFQVPPDHVVLPKRLVDQWEAEWRKAQAEEPLPPDPDEDHEPDKIPAEQYASAAADYAHLAWSSSNHFLEARKGFKKGKAPAYVIDAAKRAAGAWADIASHLFDSGKERY